MRPASVIFLSVLLLCLASASWSFLLPVNQQQCTRNRRPSQLLLLASTNNNFAELKSRICLEDRFDRWRYLQKLLDEEVLADDVNQILYGVLDGFLKYPRPKYMDSEETGSPELTLELRQLIGEILASAEGTHAIVAMVQVGENNEELDLNDELADSIQKLLPDEIEDEDAAKSLWDTVISLHGRESVKINEQQKRPSWKACCLLARVLLHFDFLSYGLMD